MTKPKLVNREDVLKAINKWIVEKGLPPTIEELRSMLKVGSTRTVLRYLHDLEVGGDIDRWSGARGIRLKRHAESGTKTIRVPLVGEATAGALMLAEENLEGWVQLPAEFLKPKSARHFLLRVKGDSMNQANVSGGKIENGDLALAEQRSSAEQGEIVVALVDGEATIKRLTKAEGFYILKPESTEKYDPIILTESFQVQGVIKRVLKKGAFLLDSDY